MDFSLHLVYISRLQGESPDLLRQGGDPPPGIPQIGFKPLKLIVKSVVLSGMHFSCFRMRYLPFWTRF